MSDAESFSEIFYKKLFIFIVQEICWMLMFHPIEFLREVGIISGKQSTTFIPYFEVWTRAYELFSKTLFTPSISIIIFFLFFVILIKTVVFQSSKQIPVP